jgi:hypothetical protein
MPSTGPMTNFPQGFTNGLSIRGMPLLQIHPGQVFWVSNSPAVSRFQRSGSDTAGNRGSFNYPFATIAYALTQCLANNGDIIMVDAGHSETIGAAAAIALNVAGVAIVGMGAGSLRPTLTWSTAASTITVAANNMSFQNFLFLGGAASTFVVTAFNNANAVVATDFTIDNCEFRDVDATHGFIACYTGGTTANQSDGLSFTRNKVYRTLTSPPAANTAVVGGANIDRFVFSDNEITNNTVNNNIPLGFNFGANNVTHAQISRNKTASLNTGTTAGELFGSSSTACSGLVSDNYSGHLASTGLLGPTGTKFKFIQNFCHITGAADKSALINPSAV